MSPVKTAEPIEMSFGLWIRVGRKNRVLNGDNGLKLYKAHCNIGVRKAFFTNRVVDIWNSLPAAVVLVIMSLFVNAV